MTQLSRAVAGAVLVALGPLLPPDANHETLVNIGVHALFVIAEFNVVPFAVVDAGHSGRKILGERVQSVVSGRKGGSKGGRLIGKRGL